MSAIGMKAWLGKLYTADISVIDLNKKTRNNKLMEIDKSTRFTRQNFLLQKRTGELMYNYYLHPGDTVFFKNNSGVSKLLVEHYKREFPLAPPPFSLVERSAFNYKPDSTFVIEKNNSMAWIVIPEQGFYHIRINNESSEGLTLYSVETVFPGIKNETDMIRSTRYIMQKAEYEHCMTSAAKKACIDEFWKDIGGSNERARELLKKYYTRVMEANKLFTAHQPGWQSDRGMIYIVFGAPTATYRSDWGEEWVYGNEAQGSAVRFNFSKVQNVFTDNDFVLRRSEYFKDPWYRAVDYWRQGHIYLDN